MKRLLSWLLLGVAMLACSQSQPQIVVITATPEPSETLVPGVVTATEPALTPTQVELAPITIPPTSAPREYVVQPGDSLSAIASNNDTSVDLLIELNELDNPNLLEVGQVLKLPGDPTVSTPNTLILPDSGLVRGPGSAFDVQAFVAQQPGYIRLATDEVRFNLANGGSRMDLLTAAQVVERVSEEFSVNPRVLLALLEYQSGWLTNPNPSDEQRVYPLGRVDVNRRGLYKQLSWAANQLNAGYYNWRYGDLRALELSEGVRLRIAPELNGGTVALQYFFSLDGNYDNWRESVSGAFLRTYWGYFGDPFDGDIVSPVPPTLNQPEITLPFSPGQVWYFTGGPHGGWGSGSAWSALDFAPPDDRPAGTGACYTSAFPTTAVAPGVIARSSQGSVVLDLDGDGDERTGWTVLYLHLASENRIEAGSRVQTGEIIGYPACEGGFSTATHLHIARRYNGEWLPADCHSCLENDVPSLVMSEWVTVGLENQEYQGFLVKDGERRQAEQGRNTPINRVSWP